MKEDRKAFVDRDTITGLKPDFDPLHGDPDLEERVRSGELTREQADELLQSAARRHTAEHGAGQGMDSHSGKSGRDS